MQLAKIEEIVVLNHNAVFTTFRKSGAAQMSIVTVGVLNNGVAFTISPSSAKLVNLKRNPRCSLMVSQSDWKDYAVLEGQAKILSPETTSSEELRLTLREVYRSASGKEHPDWDEFDQAVQKDGRSAIIVVPEHIYYRNSG
jgi:PPOX class probable F420-dependent enzyme